MLYFNSGYVIVGGLICHFLKRKPVNAQEHVQRFDSHETEPEKTADPEAQEVALSAERPTSGRTAKASRRRPRAAPGLVVRLVLPRRHPRAGPPLHVRHEGGGHPQNGRRSGRDPGAQRERQRVWPQQVHPAGGERWTPCCRGRRLRQEAGSSPAGSGVEPACDCAQNT